MALVAVCTDFTLNPDDTLTCHEVAYQEAFLLENEPEISNLILHGGIDPAMIELGFFAILTLWVAGLAVGLIISQVRKLRNAA